MKLYSTLLMTLFLFFTNAIYAQSGGPPPPPGGGDVNDVSITAFLLLLGLAGVLLGFKNSKRK